MVKSFTNISTTIIVKLEFRCSSFFLYKQCGVPLAYQFIPVKVTPPYFNQNRNELIVYSFDKGVAKIRYRTLTRKTFDVQTPTLGSSFLLFCLVRISAVTISTKRNRRFYVRRLKTFFCIDFVLFSEACLCKFLFQIDPRKPRY